MSEEQVPVEALRFLIKVDRTTLGAVQFAQFAHDLAHDVHVMAEGSADPATDDPAEALGEAIDGLDQAIGAAEMGFESGFDSYESMERSRDAAEASARAIEAALDALEAMGEYAPDG